jgi:peptide-methionine (R)-S-oxide reductase
MKKLLYSCIVVIAAISCSQAQPKKFAIMKSESEWKKQLNDTQYEVARKQGTEIPFENAYWNNHEKGIYKCVCCGQVLFNSDTKFESGTGWPSFSWPANKKAVEENKDLTMGMARREIHCSQCGSHLGHLFEDGPKPTGLRYCMNSASLVFEKK